MITIIICVCPESILSTATIFSKMIAKSWADAEEMVGKKIIITFYAAKKGLRSRGSFQKHSPISFSSAYHYDYRAIFRILNLFIHKHV